MSAKDIYHEHVKSALESDGWKITDDPYSFTLGHARRCVRCPEGWSKTSTGPGELAPEGQYRA